MKNFVKYAAVGVAGYLIGFYEMKYKAMKALLQVAASKQDDGVEQEPKEEGSQ